LLAICVSPNNELLVSMAGTVRKRGGGVSIVLPAPFVRALEWKEGDRVQIVPFPDPLLDPKKMDYLPYINSFLIRKEGSYIDIEKLSASLKGTTLLLDYALLSPAKRREMHINDAMKKVSHMMIKGQKQHLKRGGYVWEAGAKGEIKTIKRITTKEDASRIAAENMEREINRLSKIPKETKRGWISNLKDGIKIKKMKLQRMKKTSHKKIKLEGKQSFIEIRVRRGLTKKDAEFIWECEQKMLKHAEIKGYDIGISKDEKRIKDLEAY